MLRLESILLIFLGQNPSYSRRWATEVTCGTHKSSGRALLSYGQLVGPLWYFFAPTILIYFTKKPREVSGHLESRIFTTFSMAFQVQNFSFW